MTNRQIMKEYVLHGTQNLEPVEILKALRDEPKNIMSSKDYKLYQNLPEEVSVYRGCSLEELEEGEGLPLGISWSLDKETAEFFAYRYGGEGKCVVMATVPKSDIRFITNERSEAEVVLFSQLLDEVEIVSSDVKDYDCDKFHQFIEEKYR